MKISLAVISALLLTNGLLFASEHGVEATHATQTQESHVVSDAPAPQETHKAHGGVHWGYTGHGGPQDWGNLSDEYKMCGIGKSQSPINIVSSVEGALKPIEFFYSTAPVEILNNGHTVQVNVAGGSSVEIEGVCYELKQYHFHTPSENTIHSKSYPLEAHFVHADENGNLAVIAVMFEEGKENSQLKELWNKMPMSADEHATLSNVAKDVNALLPAKKDYYRFSGSLTTPPCSEGVKWIVLKNPLTISKAQVEKFAQAVHGQNNRPVQPLNARIIVK